MRDEEHRDARFRQGPDDLPGNLRTFPLVGGRERFVKQNQGIGGEMIGGEGEREDCAQCKALRDFEWAPRISHIEGIQRLFDWVTANRALTAWHDARCVPLPLPEPLMEEDARWREWREFAGVRDF